MPDAKAQRLKLVEHRQILVAYLLMKVEQNDLHAVSDAANDIRELDVKLEGLR